MFADRFASTARFSGGMMIGMILGMAVLTGAGIF